MHALNEHTLVDVSQRYQKQHIQINNCRREEIFCESKKSLVIVVFEKIGLIRKFQLRLELCGLGWNLW